MGLDIYFYHKQLHEIIQDNEKGDYILNNLPKDNTALSDCFERLYKYSKKSNEEFTCCLIDAINDYLDNMGDAHSDESEIAYFRKFWWIVSSLNYGDDCYARDKDVPKETLETWVELSEKAIKNVLNEFTKKGLVIDKSPLSFPEEGLHSGYIQNLTFKNSAFSNDLMCKADEICRKIFVCSDTFLFEKVCSLYWQSKYMLQNTDWEKQKVVINANW